ncbi:MAG: FoF1 ATP synthase subunit gamma [Anaerolineaceae bacterium]|jgi:ATP synthase F1 gamma subunit
MAEGKERAQSRLQNLQTIEPLISSLRVLSLSTMQMAMNRQESLDAYAERFNEVAELVWRTVDRKKVVKVREEAFDYRPIQQHQVLAVIGSTRGIVGQYNKNLARLTSEHLRANPEEDIRVLAFGRRIHSVLSQEGVTFTERGSLSTGSLPDYDAAASLIREWDQRIEEGTLKKVSVLSYRRRNSNTIYQPRLTELLPGKLERKETEVEDESWLVPIVEGDPELIFGKIEGHMVAIEFYRMILDAVAAENLFRFRLLEEAKENTTNLLEELSLEVQANRRREITQQLQELLAGSGMLAQR